MILLIFIYFNCACTKPIIPYTQQTDREPQYPAPACTTLLYFNGTPMRAPYLLSIGKLNHQQYNIYHSSTPAPLIELHDKLSKTKKISSIFIVQLFHITFDDTYITPGTPRLRVNRYGLLVIVRS
jgi:hypothetical protein